MASRLLALVGAALVIAACGSAQERTTTTAATGTNTDGDTVTLVASSASLPGTSWVLADSTSASVVPTIAFADGHVSGTGGCNQYSGAYTVDGQRISFDQMVSTQMACVGEGNAIESRFFAQLAKVARWAISDNQLVLSDKSGQALLRFRTASPLGSWRATALLHQDAVRSPAAGTEITAEFKADGSLSGSAGCNTYHGTYTLKGSSLTISRVASTRKHCATPDGVMAQEQAYLAGLELVRSYKLARGGLTMLSAAGTIVASFQPAG